MFGFWIFISVLVVCETMLRIYGKPSILMPNANRGESGSKSTDAEKKT
jgi:hypothetical protein